MQKHHLDATQILDQMQVKFLYFLFSLKESMILPWLLCFTFFDLAHLFFRRTFGGENCFFQSEPIKIRVVPLCSSTALYFLDLSVFLSERKAVFVHSSNCRSYHWIWVKIKKKLWHFNGVLLEALQFSMLSYSNSCHLLWANNSISNLLTHLESVRCEIWIFPPVL